MSEGMLCDGPMLGWAGGGAGTAVLLPDTFKPGDKLHGSRPRLDGGSGGDDAPAAPRRQIHRSRSGRAFEKKMSKEEKKAALAAKRAARAAKKAGGEGDDA